MNPATVRPRGRWWSWSGSRQPPDTPATHPGVYVNWTELVALESLARRVRWPPQSASARSLLAGRYGSRVRGRGLDFIELRQYLPGDDTRSIDWRATARTGTPHVRVYAEERDRPTWLVVDQRLSMFFARRGSLRSVVAVEAAAIWGWRALTSGDRVGGLVVGDQGFVEVRPRRGRQSLLRLLRYMTEHNHALRADSPVIPGPDQLNHALEALVRQAPRNAVIAVLSDFDGLGTATREALLALSRHNSLVLLPIWEDPSSLRAERLVVSDGQWQVTINHANPAVQRSLAGLAQQRMDGLLSLRSELGCSVLPLVNTEPTLEQLARGLDSRPMRRSASLAAGGPA